MKNSSHVTIQNPCSENWHGMSATEGGKFCSQCQKKVIDFTQKSEEEIRRTIAESSNPICGRIKGTQLQETIIIRNKESYKLFPFRLFTFSLLLSSVNSYANHCITTIIPRLDQNSTISTHFSKDTIHQQVSGFVLDATTKEPLQGVTVYLKGTTTGTYSNENGYFELPLSEEHLKPEMTFRFEFIGMIAQEITIRQHELSKPVEILLIEDTNILIGNIVVTNYKKKWWPFKWFHSRK